MALYTIADPHLSFGTDKPMDVFRGWSDYTEKLKTNWERLVTPADTVVLPGDISWAMTLSDTAQDLAWLDAVFARYPELIIENCSSGGLRMDYAMLSRYSIQSTSDVEDYRYYATIAANAPSVLTPEQAAVWSYPLADGDDEQTAFNMVNAMMLRIHQSGHLARINPSGKKLVKEGIRVYKRMRNDIRNSFAFWPLGLSDYDDPWVSLGLRTNRRAYVAVWRRSSENDTINLPIGFLQDKKVRVQLLYPAEAPCSYSYNPGTSSLTVKIPEQYSARIFLLRY